MINEQRVQAGRIGLWVVAAYIVMLVVLGLVVSSCDEGWELTR